MTEQEACDRALAERLMHTANDLMQRGSEATLGLGALMRHLRERDPIGFDAACAQITLSRLGLPTRPRGGHG